MRVLDLQLSLGTLAFATVIATGCSELPPPSHAERSARLLAPPPACVRGLRATASTDGVRRGQVSESDVWAAVIPAFDVEHVTLPSKDATACTGARIDVGSVSTDRPRHPDHPQLVAEGDIRFVAGSDHLQLAWLRITSGDDAMSAGPLALLRDRGDVVEIYAVGTLRARDDEHLRLSLERIGGRLAVTATEDGCVSRKPGSECASTIRVFAAADGQLTPVASIDTERVTFINATEPGSAGRLEAHLTTSHQFTDRGLKVFEQLLVSDDQRHPLRAAEREREIDLSGSGAVHESAPSLWTTISGDGRGAASTPAKTATSDR